jgi:uncharacterized protein (TIGR03118 family)
VVFAAKLGRRAAFLRVATSLTLVGLGAEVDRLRQYYKRNDAMKPTSTGICYTVACIALAAGLGSSGALAGYIQTNLASDVPGLAAFTDANLINPWGISFLATSPAWIANQGSGTATLHTGTGSQLGLVVTTPPNPTGTVANGTTSFGLTPGGNPARFLFSTLDGRIAGWNPSVSATTAVTMVATPGAAYTGLAIGNIGGNGLLYAADFAGAKIDVFNATFGLTSLGGTFVDPGLPAGYAPYNIQNINGKLYVEYAAIDPITSKASQAANHGIVSVFDLDGSFLQRLITNANLNSPWGITLASANFGQFSNDLLVGNNGDGTIGAFDPISGTFLGLLRDGLGNPLTNPGLWALTFGNGASGLNRDGLFFTAGINNEANGLFGEIQLATPLPAALPLFATGLGILGLLGGRRKRKAIAAA